MAMCVPIPRVDVVDGDAARPREAAADLLVRRVLLVGTAGIAVEREERLPRIIHRQSVVLDVLHDVGAAEVPRDTRVYDDINGVAGRHVAV